MLEMRGDRVVSSKKLFLFAPLAVLLLSLLLSVIHYFLEISPQLDELDRDIESYSGAANNYSLIESIANQEEGQEGIFRYVVRMYAAKEQKQSSEGVWHLKSLNWSLWLRLLYSKNQIFSLWLSQVPYNGQLGVYGASKYYFNEDFENLSCHQVIQLVVSVRSPTKFRPGTDSSERRIKEISELGLCNSLKT